MSSFLIKKLISEIFFGIALTESVENRKLVNLAYEAIDGDAILEKLLVGEPVSVPELRKLLRKRILNFEFIKLDGEVRPAQGTTMMKYIPKSDHPKGIRPSSPRVATFFDLDKRAWRSVSNRSKEVVMKYGFGEKKKPVFVVKDKDQEVEEPTTPAEEIPAEEPDILEPDVDIEEPIDIEPEIGDEDILDVDPIRKPEAEAIPVEEPGEVKDIIDVDPIRKPEVEPIIRKARYGFRPKIKEPKEDLPSPGEIEDMIVRPKARAGWRIKSYKDPKPPVQILLPQPIGRPLPDPDIEEPADLSRPGPKPPPLSIEPEEGEVI